MPKLPPPDMQELISDEALTGLREIFPQTTLTNLEIRDTGLKLILQLREIFGELPIAFEMDTKTLANDGVAFTIAALCLQNATEESTKLASICKSVLVIKEHNND